MKKAKFRVWNTLDKCFIGTTSALFFSVLLEALKGSKYYEAHQYTGLKDKNGVEIYEGDILATEGEYRSVVKFGGGSFCIQYITKWISPWVPMRGIAIDRYSVIGNIYENFELVEGGDL